MRLVIGGEPLFGPPTGIGHYTSHLIDNLINKPEIDELKLLAYGILMSTDQARIKARQPLPGEKKIGVKKASLAFGKIRGIAARNSIMVSAYAKTYSAMSRWSLRRYNSHDIFHSPNYILPHFPGRRIVTILDLSTIRFPEFHPAATVKFINTHIERAINEADHILTISNFVKNEIVEHFSFPQEKITTTYLGADNSFQPVTKSEFEVSPLASQLTFKQYFLFVSTIEPRKNLVRLLDAYEIYQQEQGSKAIPLILTGLPGWKSSHIHTRLKALESKGFVRYLGYVSQCELPMLFAGARALLFPSLYEGFGLPIVEAMKSGTAVMTSKASAMSEVAGDATLYIDPNDVEDMAVNIAKLANDDVLVKQLVSRGLRKAGVYNWAQCADLTLNAYRNLAV